MPAKPLQPPKNINPTLLSNLDWYTIQLPPSSHWRSNTSQYKTQQKSLYISVWRLFGIHMFPHARIQFCTGEEEPLFFNKNPIRAPCCRFFLAFLSLRNQHRKASASVSSSCFPGWDRNRNTLFALSHFICLCPSAPPFPISLCTWKLALPPTHATHSAAMRVAPTLQKLPQSGH